jgi:hypothetical protein
MSGPERVGGAQAVEPRRASGKRSVLVLVGLILVASCPSLVWQADAMAGGGQTCAPLKALPPPSYESFFGRQQRVAAESPEWQIRLVEWQPSEWPPHKFTFSVKNGRTGALWRFTLGDTALPFQPLQIDAVDLINPTRALILGRVAATSPVVSVVELPSGKVEDHFTCFMPALSPGHQFLAFIKNFPPHPGPVEISNEYIVYDLTQSAEYNRPHFKPGVTYDAGWPVYPPGAANAVGESVLPEGSAYHTCTSRGLFWLDNNNLAFTDLFQGENRLVVVNLSRGVRDPDVRTSILYPSELVDLDRCKKASAPSDFEKWSEEPAGLIHVQQIEPVPASPGMACLYFVSNPCLRYPSLMVKLP